MKLGRRAVLGALATLPMVRLAAGATAHRLTIIHMNDFHSRHEPVDAAALTCKPEAGGATCFGGAARLAGAILAQRQAAEAAGRTVMLVDAGDQFQGSLFYTAWHGEAELAVMHQIGTEAMGVGNHEFDNGPANLAKFIRAARFPIVSANIDASAQPDLAGLIKSGTIIVKDGLPIGIVGATTLETVMGSSPGPLVKFGDPAAALGRAAASVRAAGAKIVIALSHLGVDIDRTLAGNVPGIDAFIGGHSHTLLSDGEAEAYGPAHQAFDGAAGRAVVVQAACYGRYLGRLDLDIDAEGGVLAYGGDVRHIGLDLPEEPRVAAIVAGYAAQLDTVRKRVVGHAAAPIVNEGCRVGECPLGNFIADAMLASTNGADIAIMNAGGIRTGLPGGDITLGAVLTALPFGNSVATLKLSGADLQAALLNGVGRAGKGGFPQIAGARLSWRTVPGAPSEIVAVEIRGPDGAFAPLDPARVYSVVTNNFMRAGGDGYVVFRDRAIDPYDLGPNLDEAVTNAIQAAPELQPRVDGRIVAAH